MRRVIVGIVFALFIADLIYKNFYEEKTLSSHSASASSQSPLPLDLNNTNTINPSANDSQSSPTQSKEDPTESKPKENPPKHTKSKASNSKDDDDEFEGELPEDLEINQITIKYCKYTHPLHFQTLATYITGNYTSIKVIGEEYPISKDKETIANILMASMVIFIALILASDYIKPFLPFIPERLLAFLSTSKFLFAISCYLFHTYLINKSKSTGAFEVYADNRLIWSKMQRNALPSYEDIILLLNI